MAKTKAQNTHTLKDKELYLVERTGTGNWQIHYKVPTLNKWHRRSANTADLEKAKANAWEFVAELSYAAKRGLPLFNKKFAAIADLVSEECKAEGKTGKAPKVYAQYPNIIKTYLTPFFGNMYCDAINAGTITEFHKWRYRLVGREFKKSTQNTHNMVLTKIFDKAVELQYMSEKQRPKLKNTGDEGETRGTFTYDELVALEKFLCNWATEGRTQKTRDLRELLILYVAFVAATGARPGTELYELRWKHIQFVETAAKNRAIRIDTPQGKVGARPMYAQKEMWPVLEKLKQLHTEFDSVTLDELVAGKNEEYVFRMRNGARPYNFVNVFKDGLNAANMLTNGRDEHIRTLYSLRHYYATQRLYENMTYEKLEEQMGTSVKMLKDHYKHLDIDAYADELTGSGGNAELTKYLSPARANLIGLMGAATGIYLALPEQNYDATQELEEALLQKRKKKK
jgi:integrase